jgi:hypothetical protein
MDYLSEDEVAAFRDSAEFDEQWYVEQYPDVKLVGMDPAKHYLWLGAKLGRKPSRHSDALAVQSAAEDHILAAGEPVSFVRGAIKKIQSLTDSRSAAKILTPEFRSKVEESGLFEPGYYRANYRSGISHPDDLLFDYISAFKRDPDRDPGRLFSTRYYLDTHRDVKNMHPFVHYIEYGMNEGRAAFSPEKVNAFLSDAGYVDLHSFFDILPCDRAINILYWEEGNFFFADIAHYLEQLLTELGFEVAVRTDSPDDDGLNLVIAPHEYCALGPGRLWSPEQYADAVYVSTEQWQTSWFALSLKYLKATKRGTLDLCFIHTPRFNRPIKPDDPDVLSAQDFAQIARNSKIMLNIHQGDSHYIEWQRMFLIGMMQGAVVISEPCYPNDYVKADVHYVEASLESMPAVLIDLLTTKAGREKMSEIHANVAALRERISNGERLLK